MHIRLEQMHICQSTNREKFYMCVYTFISQLSLVFHSSVMPFIHFFLSLFSNDKLLSNKFYHSYFIFHTFQIKKTDSYVFVCQSFFFRVTHLIITLFRTIIISINFIFFHLIHILFYLLYCYIGHSINLQYVQCLGATIITVCSLECPTSNRMAHIQNNSNSSTRRSLRLLTYVENYFLFNIIFDYAQSRT